jgi:IMP dehydrogenase
LNGKLLGLVTARDIQFIHNDACLLRDVMTKDLIVASSETSLHDVYGILDASKKGKLPLINASGALVALVSRSDLLKNLNYPHASKRNGRLVVGAFVHKDKTRLKLLVQQGVDVVVTSRLDMLIYSKKTYPYLDVIVVHVMTREQAAQMIEAGADAIAMTRDIYRISEFCRLFNVPTIVETHHAVNALALGASAVTIPAEIKTASVRTYVTYASTTVQHALHDIACLSIGQLHEDVRDGRVRFEKKGILLFIKERCN